MGDEGYGGGRFLEAAELALRDPLKRLDEQVLEQILEPAIEEECEDRKSYSLALNSGVLKAYAIHPLMFNFDVVKLILAQALMQLPKEHFTLALFLIPQSVYAIPSSSGIGSNSPASSEKSNDMDADKAKQGEPMSPVIALLVRCEGLLRSCRFSEFWNVIETYDQSILSFLSEIDGFYETVRAYIMSVVIQSHRAISRKVLSKMLNCDDIVPFLTPCGWELTSPNDIVREKKTV